ncbi:unnamed protein product [Plutella xylostella]|uniref:(diamondback moth) hypothetical protein n=1 Tax=Plutella xylostella TaxID=51655 RepID=A0A8S4GEI3_PLUXY|nr:unnamed protein product [Plutella xylostella]
MRVRGVGTRLLDASDLGADDLGGAVQTVSADDGAGCPLGHPRGGGHPRRDPRVGAGGRARACW